MLNGFKCYSKYLWQRVHSFTNVNKCKQRENIKKHPYFHFELKRQAKNWQGGVIIDFSHIQGRVRKYIIFNNNLIFLGAGKNYTPFPNEGLNVNTKLVYFVI